MSDRLKSIYSLFVLWVLFTPYSFSQQKLSDATENMLHSLDDSLNIELYISGEIPDSMVPFFQQIETLVQLYSFQSINISVTRYDPDTISDEQYNRCIRYLDAIEVKNESRNRSESVV